MTVLFGRLRSGMSLDQVRDALNEPVAIAGSDRTTEHCSQGFQPDPVPCSQSISWRTSPRRMNNGTGRCRASCTSILQNRPIEPYLHGEESSEWAVGGGGSSKKSFRERTFDGSPRRSLQGICSIGGPDGSTWAYNVDAVICKMNTKQACLMIEDPNAPVALFMKPRPQAYQHT